MRGTDILSLPKPVTISYGLNFFSYTAAKFWNALPDKLRNLSSLHDFIFRYRLILKIKYLQQGGEAHSLS